jgi:hypothetical protein
MKHQPIYGQQLLLAKYATLLQAERTYHSQLPLKQLYTTLSDVSKNPEQSTTLFQQMHEAAKTEMARVHRLRTLDTQQRKNLEASGNRPVELLASLQALLEAKLRFMQGGMVGTSALVGGLPVCNQQFSTDAGNVLTLA